MKCISRFSKFILSFGPILYAQPGRIYPALTYLHEIGHSSVEQQGTRKLYNITPEGKTHLEENRANAEAILDAPKPEADRNRVVIKRANGSKHEKLAWGEDTIHCRSIGILDTIAVPASIDWATELKVSHISPETSAIVEAHSISRLAWRMTSRKPVRKTMKIALPMILTITRVRMSHCGGAPVYIK